MTSTADFSDNINDNFSNIITFRITLMIISHDIKVIIETSTSEKFVTVHLDPKMLDYHFSPGWHFYLKKFT